MVEVGLGDRFRGRQAVSRRGIASMSRMRFAGMPAMSQAACAHLPYGFDGCDDAQPRQADGGQHLDPVDEFRHRCALPDRLARVQQIEGHIDPVMGHVMGDIMIDAERAPQPFFHHARSCDRPHTWPKAKPRQSLPLTGWKGRVGFLRPRLRRRSRCIPPTLMADLERRAHHADIADTFEGIIDAAIGHLDDDGLVSGPSLQPVMQLQSSFSGGSFEPAERISIAFVERRDPLRAQIPCDRGLGPDFGKFIQRT